MGLLALSIPAVAQPSAPASAPVLAQSSAPSEPDPEQSAAKEAFTRAVALYKEGKVEEALPIFVEVAAATGSPNARLYVGRCYADLRRFVEAYEAFSQTVREINQNNEERYEETREAAIAQLSLLTPRVAKLVVSVVEIPSGLSVTVDAASLSEKQIGSSLVLEPGVHRVEARAPGIAPESREVEIEGGELKTVTLSFKRYESSRPSAPVTPAPDQAPEQDAQRARLRSLGFLAGGVGAGGLAVFTVAGLMARNTYNSLERECGESGCSDARVHRGKTQQTIANVGLVVGGLGLAASGALLLVTMRDGKETGASIAIAPGYGVVSYRSTF